MTERFILDRNGCQIRDPRSRYSTKICILGLLLKVHNLPPNHLVDQQSSLVKQMSESKPGHLFCYRFKFLENSKSCVNGPLKELLVSSLNENTDMGFIIYKNWGFWLKLCIICTEITSIVSSNLNCIWNDVSLERPICISWSGMS